MTLAAVLTRAQARAGFVALLRLVGCLAACLAGCLAGAARAGTLTRPAVEAMFPPPLIVGEKMGHVPVWPIFRRTGATPEIQSYVFETLDLEAVAGYGGKPLNLIVVMDRDGTFVQTRLLAHSEPIFRSEKGTTVLAEFAAQYQGLTVQHEIQVLTRKAQRQVSPTKATLHGILAGTLTANAIGRSIMESSAQVAQAVAQAAAQAQARSGPDQTGADTAKPQRGANDRFQRTGWNGLAAAGLVQAWTVSQGEVETRFRGSAGAGRDAQGLIHPQALALDIWLSWIALPQAGRNALEASRWREVRALREQGQAYVHGQRGRCPCIGAPLGRGCAGGGQVLPHQRQPGPVPATWVLGRRLRTPGWPTSRRPRPGC